MFIVAKKVKDFNYYWNEVDSRWEGLSNNATKMKDSQMVFWNEKIMNGKEFLWAYTIRVKDY